jgi:hypothetical protein
MPEISNDELGRRIFALQKEKATEEAIEKIRQSPESDLPSIALSDRAALEYLLGEGWVSLGREEWEKCAFSRLTSDDLKEMIGIGQELLGRRITDDTAMGALSGVLRRTFE